ncbi:MAG: hypothetical protein CML29_04650 [Rhizobiales bacterium]|nr:hypothetical protein [Hyphomicrobiales bacterium]MBA67984.1 hypothetical protein [Hyphomicrobiales bacterium]
MAKLTTDLLKRSMPEKGKRLELRDEEEAGLIFRVTEKGKRSWSVRYVNASGEHRRKSIGPFPSISLSRAREEARKIKGAVAGGADLVQDTRLARAEAMTKKLRTLEGLAESYFVDATLGLHRPNARGAKRDSTLREERRVFDKLIKKEMGALPLADIKRADIQALVSRLSKKAPSNGRHARNVIRQLMSYALSKDLIPANPAHDIAVITPTPRERVLDDDEIRAIWRACTQPGAVEKLALSIEMGIALRLALATLQRGGEVIGAHWTEIDLDKRLWTVPAARMKGKRPHVVPLNEIATGLLLEASEAMGAEGHVFKSSAEERGHFDRHAFTRSMNRLTTALKIPRATPHDFRRTGATNLTSERIGIPRFVVSQVLAHSGDTGGSAVVTGRHYDLYDYLAEKRRALDAWGRLLTEIVSGESRSENVIPLTSVERSS